MGRRRWGAGIKWDYISARSARERRKEDESEKEEIITKFVNNWLVQRQAIDEILKFKVGAEDDEECCEIVFDSVYEGEGRENI